jgi:hypothetical protein
VNAVRENRRPPAGTGCANRCAIAPQDISIAWAISVVSLPGLPTCVYVPIGGRSAYWKALAHLTQSCSCRK